MERDHDLESGLGGSKRACEGIRDGLENEGQERSGGSVREDFDLNGPFLEDGCDDKSENKDFQEGVQSGRELSDRRMEIVESSGRELSDRIVEVVENSSGKEALDWNENKTGDGYSFEDPRGLDLNFYLNENHWGDDEDSYRRYTREEKGKRKLSDSWLSKLTLTPEEIARDLRFFGSSKGITIRDVETEVSDDIKLCEASEEAKYQRMVQEEELEIAAVLCSLQNFSEEKGAEEVKCEIQEAERDEESARLRAEEVKRGIQEAERHEESARSTMYRKVVKEHGPRLARGLTEEEEHEIGSVKQEEHETPSSEADIKLEDLLGPFSSALRIIRDRNAKQSTDQLIEWKPAVSGKRRRLAPTLLDLSLKVLAKNAEGIFSLENISDQLKQRLCSMLCDSRKMNLSTLDLFVRDSPSEIRLKDASWLTEEQFRLVLQKLDTKNLRVLQLDLSGQCLVQEMVCKSLFSSSKSLACLGIISLRGACRLSDDMLKDLLKAAPRLQSANLGQCSLITSIGIKFLANSLDTSLRELYIDECPRIDAMEMVTSLKKFEHLEVLSLAGIETVCDKFLEEILTARGGNIKELDLNSCSKLTNKSTKVIGENCPGLCSLNISNLHLTDLGLLYLANGCKSICILKLARNRFSDEAVAAFLEVSGGSLVELSLNGVKQVAHSTAFSLAKCSRKLSSLDLSWCRRLTDEALGLIADRCSSLKLLKAFGCKQITNVFLDGHSNSQVQIIGLTLTPLLDRVDMLERWGVQLRYSSLQSPAVSSSVDT